MVEQRTENPCVRSSILRGGIFNWDKIPWPDKFAGRRKMINYGITKKVNQTFEQVIESLPEKLKKEGFGILTQIDVKDTLKKKLDVDFRKYMIIGACNPPLAYQALQKEDNIGLLLPCNVIVHEKDGDTYLSVIRPTVTMHSVENPSLKEIAEEAEARLKKIFDSIN
jgi:uncharacterized protein (DUF302 family)